MTLSIRAIVLLLCDSNLEGSSFSIFSILYLFLGGVGGGGGGGGVEE